MRDGVAGAPGVNPGATGLTLPGTRIGEYSVVGFLGQGTFGDVFRGVHEVIGKTVAIKVLHARYSDPIAASPLGVELEELGATRPED